MARLDGRRILLTRSAEDSAVWAKALAGEGALPIVFPCIEALPARNAGLEQRIAEALDDADWIVFTSRRGVDAFRDLSGSDPKESTRLAAVGNSTAERIGEHFGRVDLVGAGTGEALAAELAAIIEPGVRVVLALAANASGMLEHELTKAGAMVTRFDVYRTVPAEPATPKRALSTLGSDTVIFASPSAVAGFTNQIDVDIDQRIVTIGPSTSAAVRALDLSVTAEAKEPSLSGIIESLLEADHA